MWHRPLLFTALGFAALAVACMLASMRTAAPILGVHPALKPLKFSISIALLLASMAWLFPRLSGVPRWTRDVLVWVLVSTMVIEMVPIVVQALRGTTSHFNENAGFDLVAWRSMQLAIVVATVALFTLACLATTTSLELAPLDAFAWRAGLWLSLLAALSGFRMGGTLTHTVGGADGGPGLPLFNWSRSFGDLRVSHFISLHALQALPLIALAARAWPWPALAWVTVVGAAAACLALSLATFAQALASRPVW